MEMRSFEELGIRLFTDDISIRKKLDNVMDILYEEQVLTWKLLQKEILKSIKSIKGEVDFIDIGTGSGIWAILVAKELEKQGISAKIIAVDKIRRAIKLCKKNMSQNSVNFDLKLEPYSIKTVTKLAVKTIFMNPPYHIYPKNLENFIPYHAKGGVFGFEEFINWLSIANYSLSKEGSIFFHHMCLGNEQPEFLRFIPKFISGNPSIFYYELIPPIKTFTFLRELYEHRFSSYIYETSIRYPMLFFTSGIIKKDGLGIKKRENLHPKLLNGKTWKDRIILHKEILEVSLIQRGLKNEF
jgi:hypothetical protein